ncbi:hypothetical protein MCUN1_002306 [Malassezia cuniculi]|uniref:THO complex subunit 1 n=1 Tax=Malassezia cuniculi TaxID=948313 RepID=A0AAF0EZA2_9BASI|nr:hypothetical protein MCUN1_002306 [Malassezia cuniculi]
MSEPRLARALDESLPAVLDAVIEAQGQSKSVGEVIDAATTAAGPIVDVYRHELGDSTALDDLQLTTANAKMHQFVLQGSSTQDTFARLDVALALQCAGVTDAALPHTLLEDILERAPVSECSVLFSYLETRAELLGKDMLPTKGKGLVFLRLCNELLRRLAKTYSEHAVFAGRVLTLLSTTFSIGERSGVNLRGDFNTDNICPIQSTEVPEAMDEDQPEETNSHDAQAKAGEHEEAAETESVRHTDDASTDAATDADADAKATTQQRRPRKRFHADTVQDPHFYVLFWSLQRYFAEPALVFSADGPGKPAVDALDVSDPAVSGTPELATFRRLVRCTLEVFSKFALPTKKRAALRDEPKSVRDSFYPKFLSGRALLDFELHDSDFRRHVLLQFLIIFQYLLSFSETSRERSREWKNQLMLAQHSITSNDERWIRTVWREVQNQICDSGPGGREFLDTAVEILRRENHWIQWKGAGAPPIEKERASLDLTVAHPAQPAPYPFELGTAALSKIWGEGYVVQQPGTRRCEDDEGNEVEVATDGLEELEIPPPVPSLGSLSRRITLSEQRNPDDQGMRQSLAWRALRAAGNERLHLFKYMEGVDDISGLVRAIDAEDRGEEFAVDTVEERKDDENVDAVEENKNETSADAVEERKEEACADAIEVPTSAETGNETIYMDAEEGHLEAGEHHEASEEQHKASGERDAGNVSHMQEDSDSDAFSAAPAEESDDGGPREQTDVQAEDVEERREARAAQHAKSARQAATDAQVSRPQ